MTAFRWPRVASRFNAGISWARDARGHLIVQALVAARRDEDVARPMRDYVGERADWIAELVRAVDNDAMPLVIGNLFRCCRGPVDV